MNPKKELLWSLRAISNPQHVAPGALFFNFGSYVLLRSTGIVLVRYRTDSL